ncbi:CRISPR-associated endoribonuclease Cas6 [Sulfobacillus thermosulfidooxidans]|uniref:CRISPR-associated endoribonuclease Cas6 n=1 Tax=Sulfobacillus thermosulfidooxidans TaxID=28034 RepID=UPI0006B439BB|nr:CRISPR-associated endoribonuclease Cas6 [Sulfobacillus thermosulfidooxidans]
MRVTLELDSKFIHHNTLVLPYHYVEWVQAAIYNSMQQNVAQAVHDMGFPVDGRPLRLFAFSRIQGRFRVNKETIAFTYPVRLVIASPLKLLIQQFVNALVSAHEFHIGPETCRLASVSVDDIDIQTSHIRVRTLSPITVHSTMTKADGRPYTVYYHPKEHEFEEQVLQNLLRKYIAVTGSPFLLDKTSPPFRLRLKNEAKLNIVQYKKTIIKGYSGLFDIEGPPALLQIGWDAGFGDRNSQGFGLVEMAHTH